MEPLESRQLLTAASPFLTATTITTGLTGSYDSVVGKATGDFNGDGKTDLLIVENAGTLNVLLSNGDGTFQAPLTTTLPAGSSFVSLAVGDINKDGKLDLAVAYLSANISTPTLAIYYGNGDGTFQTPTTIVNGEYVDDLHIADINGDGRPDLVYANGTGVSLMLQNANGTFGSVSDITAGGAARAIGIGDLNGDGHVDIVTAEKMFYGVGNLDVLYGNGDGTFQAPVFLGVNQAGPAQITLADLNGDGHLDIVDRNDGQSTANSIISDIDVLVNSGNGTFPTNNGYAIPIPDPYSASLDDEVVVDFNGDGIPDIVTTGDNTLGVLFGNGDGTFQSGLTTTIPAGEYSLMVGDFNGDGKPDIIMPSNDGSTLTEILNSGSPVATPKLTVTPNGEVINASKPITFTFTVARAAGDPTPTGTVTFGESGEASLATVTLVDNGNGTSSATYTDPSFHSGYNLMEADYSGDFNYLTTSADSGIDISASVTPTSNLGITYSKSTVPASVISGGKTTGDVTVNVTNSGGAKYAGPQTIDVFATANGTIDGSSLEIGTVTTIVKVAAGGSSPVSVPIKRFPLLSTETYTLIAELVDTSVAASTGPTLIAAAPFVAFSESITKNTLASSIVSGSASKASLQLRIANGGNIASSGLSTVALYASTDGTLATASLIHSASTKLAVSTTKPLLLTVPVVAIPVLANGNYFIIAKITDASGNVTSTSTASTIAIAAPFISLTESVSITGAAALLAAGKTKASAVLVIANAGNVAALGNGTVSLSLQQVGNSATLLFLKSVPEHFNIISVKPLTLHIPLGTIPGLVSGDFYQLLAQVTDPKGAITSTLSVATIQAA